MLQPYDYSSLRRFEAIRPAQAPLVRVESHKTLFEALSDHMPENPRFSNWAWNANPRYSRPLILAMVSAEKILSAPLKPLGLILSLSTMFAVSYAFGKCFWIKVFEKVPYTQLLSIFVQTSKRIFVTLTLAFTALILVRGKYNLAARQLQQIDYRENVNVCLRAIFGLVNESGDLLEFNHTDLRTALSHARTHFKQYNKQHSAVIKTADRRYCIVPDRRTDAWKAENKKVILGIIAEAKKARRVLSACYLLIGLAGGRGLQGNDITEWNFRRVHTRDM